MDGKEGVNTTVQGLGTPVPVAESARAGFQASISDNCNATPGINPGLAGVVDNTTSKTTKSSNKEAQALHEARL